MKIKAPNLFGATVEDKLPKPKKARGRPRGSTQDSKGEVKKSYGVAMTQPQWALLDRIRGNVSRGDFVALLLRGEVRNREKRSGIIQVKSVSSLV